MGVRLMAEVLDYAPKELSFGERYVLMALAERANDETREVWAHKGETPRAMLERRCHVTPSGLRKLLGGLAANGLEVRVPLSRTEAGKPIFAHRGRHSTDFVIPPLRTDLLGNPVDEGESRPDRDTIPEQKPTRSGHLSDPIGTPSEPERRPDPVTPSLLPSDPDDAREEQRLEAGARAVIDKLGPCDDARLIAERVRDKCRPDGELARYIAGIPAGDLTRFRREPKGKGSSTRGRKRVAPDACRHESCAGGWLGDDAEGRPIPCPTCRPHLRERQVKAVAS